MAAIEGPVDLFNGGVFVQAFKSEDKARKFASNPRRGFKAPTFVAHDDKNGAIVTAGRPAGVPNHTMMVAGVKTEINPLLQRNRIGGSDDTRVDWSVAAYAVLFANNFEEERETPAIMRPSYDRGSMIDRMEYAY